mgnify:CR=1 FL=1
MAGSDAIVVVEEWISEHYFTTDAKGPSFTARVRERRRAWDAERELGTPRTRLLAARQQLLRRFAALHNPGDPADASALNRELFEILGFTRAGLTHERVGPVTFVRSVGLEQPVVAVVDACPAETVEELLARDGATLVTPFAVDERTEVTSVARLLSTLFVGDGTRPAFALVLAGPRAIVAERTRWAEGRYLVVDVQLVLERGDERRGGELDRALTCLAADSLAPDADGEIWWTATLAEAVNHTVGVSRELREGVRLSVEIIANEVVARRRAKGLPPLAADRAQPLTTQALRFLYRILFLLYAEASPELGVLPVGAPEYEQGYSLDRLRELALVELSDPRSQQGTHLYESLQVLFRLVDRGHPEATRGDDGNAPERLAGLTFRSLRADLFRPEATALIDEVGLGNVALQQVLRHLLLSRGARGRDAGFISYAQLGINQLGAVYEGLMSYTGFFADDDLYEVARDGNAEKGSWVVPVARADGIAEKDFVRAPDPVTGEPKPVLHRRGTFVFRLAGRERKRSASYYTPEVLTRFVVSQALEELLDQDGRRTSAEEILQLTVCEPALGSGAFAIEAVRQLAEEYLRRRQEELGEAIDPDAYPRELQRVKAWIALHRVYGVDLNATAVELAEISLWLDTMVAGLQAPWFGLHLRRGNSLIGARKAVFSAAQARDRSWLRAVPQRVGPGDGELDAIAGRIPHFLLPAEGWGATAEVRRDVAELAPDEVRALRDWRRQVRAKPTRRQVDQLVELGHRVERLWAIAAQRLAIAEQQASRDLELWGQPPQISADATADGRVVLREEIEATLSDPDSAYQRLRRVMDAWCALWFWPLTEREIRPPTPEEWYDALARLLGRAGARRPPGQESLSSAIDWDALSDLEDADRAFAGAQPIDAVLAAHPWLRVCERVAREQGFFHWELDFAPVFARGGFDLQVGKPPWVRPRTDVEALLAEHDPWWMLATKPSEAAKRARRPATLALPGCRELVIDGTAEVVATAASMADPAAFPHLAGLQPNLYRCVMEQVWRHRSPRGIAGLIHPEGHFTEATAGTLRAATYRRLRRHWQFINELRIFDIDHHQIFGVHVYGDSRDAPSFLMAASLYHPDTAARSRAHDGSGEEPGLKDVDGAWDLRPHRGRILHVDMEMLRTWHDLLEDDHVPVLETKMVYVVNRASADVLARLARAQRIAELGLEFSRGWDESIDRTKGYFDVEWGTPARWDDVILQGPHLHVGTPFYKRPNETMRHNQDWSFVDLEQLPDDAIPTTAYQPRGERAAYDAAYTHWGPQRVPARSRYRVAWRRMAANTGERTLIPAIIPPGAAHVNAVNSGGGGGARTLVATGGVLNSLVADFAVRSAPSGYISGTAIARLPVLPDYHPLVDEVVIRVLRLNCLTSAYADLWREALPADVSGIAWTGGIDYPGRPALGDVTREWTPDAPLRRASDRRQALLELDALVALALEITADELCTIYRTQFPVRYGYDRRRDHYDANGRLVPQGVLRAWRTRGDGMTEEERTAENEAGYTYVYEPPFVTLDREADMRRAYAHFERVLAERGDG